MKSSSNSTTQGCGCLFLSTITIVALVTSCNRVFDTGPMPTDAEIQLEHDQIVQGQQQMDAEDKARAQLLREGHTPEDVEATIGVARAIRQAQKK